MINAKKIYLVLFFPFFAFGEENLYNIMESPDVSNLPFSNTEKRTLPLKPNQIITENKTLSKKLKKYFKNKSVSEKAIQKFLIDNSYYQSEIIKSGTAYIIKNPIQNIFVLKGNRFFNKKEIRKFIEVDENKMGAVFYDFVETAIKKAYQKQSFFKIQIKRNTVRKKWKEWVYLDILEGPRTRIAELKVKGLLSKPNSEYENYIQNNSTTLIKKGFYNKKDLETGYENLINHLKSQGYLQSKIYSDRIFFKEDKAFITINLEEGPLTLIKDIKIQNAQAIPVWEILSHIRSKVQAPLQMDLLENDLNSIEQFYKSKGYMNIKITNKENTVLYTPGERYASIIIKLDEGPKFFISTIHIQGLKRVKEEMVRSLLKLKPGDVLTPSKKEQSLLALGSTGLFTDINFNEETVGDQFEMQVLFRERKPRSLRGGLGVNSQRGFTTRSYLETAHRNLFGWGRALTARVDGQINFIQKPPFLEYDISGRYKEIFIPSYGYQGNISLSQSKSVFKYNKNNINFVRKNKISFFTNKKISKSLKVGWNILSFENRREACTQKKCPENPQRIGSTGLNFAWDRRDNIFDPSEGHINSLTTELALPLFGSSLNISFVKADLQNQFYYTLKEKYTLGLAVKAGVIKTIRNSVYIPVSRAFILGGQNSIRGYNGNIEGERIPRQKYAPIETANEAFKIYKNENQIFNKVSELEKQKYPTENVLNSNYGLININFRFPISNDLKGSLFYDLGAVQLKSKSRTVFDYGHSIGIGFRYQIFIIPIGVDIAYKLPPKTSGEEDYGFHLSIGW